MTMKGTLSHTTPLGADIFGNITRMDNMIDGLAGKLETVQAELAEKTARLNERNILLNMDQKDKTLIDAAPEEDEQEPYKSRQLER